MQQGPAQYMSVWVDKVQAGLLAPLEERVARLRIDPIVVGAPHRFSHAHVELSPDDLYGTRTINVVSHPLSRSAANEHWKMRSLTVRAHNRKPGSISAMAGAIVGIHCITAHTVRLSHYRGSAEQPMAVDWMYARHRRDFGARMMDLWGGSQCSPCQIATWTAPGHCGCCWP